MKRSFLAILVLFLVLSSAVFSNENFLYLYNTQRNTDELLNQYPLFIRFGDNVIFRGDSDLSGKLGIRMESKQFENELYIASSRNSNTLELLGDNIKIEYAEGGFILFSAHEDYVSDIYERQDDFFVVEKVDFPMVVFEELRDHNIETSDDIIDIIEKTDINRVKTDLSRLVDYRTRWTFTSFYKNICDDMKALFDEIGYESEVMEWSSWGRKGYNVIAVKKGRTDRQIIIEGHLDSTSPKKSTLAPGADDNGSGSAGVLEIARLLKDVDTEHTIIFFLPGGEEDGILGTNDYVRKHADKDLIDYVINMDMIGFTYSNPDTIFIETSSDFENFAKEIAGVGSAYSDFRTEISLRPFGSDHMPFINNDIPAVLTIEKDWDENRNYHQVTDTIDTVDFKFLERVIRMNTAAVLYFDKK